MMHYRILLRVFQDDAPGCATWPTRMTVCTPLNNNNDNNNKKSST